MKLIISRKQQGPPYKWTFVVWFTLEFSEEETKSIDKYHKTNVKLGYIDYVWDGASLSAFKSGAEFYSDDVEKMLLVEERVKTDCANLKAYLQTANSYGGTEELSI